MNIIRTDRKAVFTASTDTTAFPTDGTSPVPVATRPTLGIPTDQCPAIRFSFGGTDTANQTVNYRIISWKFSDGVYIPTVIASGVFTLGAMAMTVLSLDTAATLLADTITDTIGLPGVVVRSPANNTAADISVWPGGADYLTVETDLGTAASASVYWEQLDTNSVVVDPTPQDDVVAAITDMRDSLGGGIDSGAINSATVGATTTAILAADASRLGYVVTSLASELVYTAIGASAVMSKGGALSAMPTSTQIGGQLSVSGPAAKLALNGICASGGMTVLTQTFLQS